MSWISAFNKCHNHEKDLPGLGDIDAVNQILKENGWESVWTSIKKVKFDDFMWEDGSKFSKKYGKCLC